MFTSLVFGGLLPLAAIAGLVLCLLVSSIGFRSLVWFISLVYGLRLGAYRAVQEADTERQGKTAFPVKVAIWLTMSVLYVAMVMPTFARVSAEARGGLDPLPLLSIAGLLVMAAGIIIKAVADRQKSLAKRDAPGRFCDRGLYRMVRCPNYFGELLVWTGNLVAGASLLQGWLA
jgi:steroid 5-alpha reductase family enzyme